MNYEMWLAFADAHAPHIHHPTWDCLLEFAAQNPISGIIDLADTNDNSCISRHTEGKPGLRGDSAYKLDTEFFFREMVEPLETALATSRKKFGIKKQRKVRLTGNHCDWEREYYDQHPELKGMLDRFSQLKELGWEIIPFGKTFQYGKLSYAHGESIKTQHHAKNAVETFCRNILYAHYHSLQMYTKVLSSDRKQRWLGCCSPIVGELNPQWMENRPSAWINGFDVIEYHGSEKAFNLYPVVTTNGRCAFGGRIYGA